MRPSPSLSLRIRSHLAHSSHERTNVTARVQQPIEAAYYRGGTSRAVILQPQHLPATRAKWPSIFRQLMGSGDPYGRQLDGMGAGVSSLSKICLVEPYGSSVVGRERTGFGGIDAARSRLQARQARLDAQQQGRKKLDIDYTFVGLGIERDEVDVAGNCGNMSSAIGPYAYNAGLLSPRIYAEGDGEITVRIRNTNTGKVIDSTFDVVGGQAAVVGDYAIDGVSGMGAKIKLDFQHPYGSKTGKVLPTGRRVDTIAGYRVSCVDGANPAVFIRADEIGVDSTILPDDFNKLPEKLALLEHIRKTAAVAMGIAPTPDLVPRTIPKIGLVSMSSTHTVLSGQTLKTSEMDLVVRFLSDTQPHRAIPLTAALTTAVAARIPGTIVEQLLAPDPVMEGAITIAHASGRLQVNATMDETNKVVPVSATVYRTAKRLFEGRVFWTDNERNKAEAEADARHDNSSKRALGLAFVLESRGQVSNEPSSGEAQNKSRDTDLVEQDMKMTAREEEEAEEADQLSPPKLSHRPLRLGTTKAAEPNESTTTPLQLGTTKATEPNEPTTTPISTHPTTPLTTALTNLRNHLTTLLTDPDLPKRPYPDDLLQTLTTSYTKIVNNSRAQTQTIQGKEWHIWARSMHREKKSVRKRAEKRAEDRRKEELGVARVRRREVGLDQWGNLVGGLGSTDNQWTNKERPKEVNEPKGGSKAIWQQRGSKKKKKRGKY